MLDTIGNIILGYLIVLWIALAVSIITGFAIIIFKKLWDAFKLFM